MNIFFENLEKITLENDNFRKVVCTTQHLQIVLMSLLPGGEIGEEVHETVDQFFRFESGEGVVVVSGEQRIVGDGYGVVIPAGTKHNVINTSKKEKLKFYTIYAPPHHKDGVTHVSKKEAIADATDHL